MNNTQKVTFIGDCHGKYPYYFKICDKYEYTYQVGDMAFDYRPLMVIDPSKHKFHPGNHDNYDTWEKSPHSIDSYGNKNFGLVELNGVRFFFIRGGHSIDRKYRTQGRDYWSNEELNYTQMDECYNEYLKIKPDIVVSHEVPTPICHLIGNPGILIEFGYDGLWTSNTAKFLESLRYIHQPKLWIHGHFHKQYQMTYEGTKFVGLAELGTYEVNNG